MARDPLDEINQAFRPWMSRPCWGVKVAYAQNLYLNAGQPRLEIREPREVKSRFAKVRSAAKRRHVSVWGQWFLWIHMCEWEIRKGRRLLATSESPPVEAQKAAAFVDGQIINAVSVRQTGTSSFSFDQGATLSTTPYGDDPTHEQWLLYAPRGRVLTFLASGSVQWTWRGIDGEPVPVGSPSKPARPTRRG